MLSRERVVRPSPSTFSARVGELPFSGNHSSHALVSAPEFNRPWNVVECVCVNTGHLKYFGYARGLRGVMDCTRVIMCQLLIVDCPIGLFCLIVLRDSWGGPGVSWKGWYFSFILWPHYLNLGGLRIKMLRKWFLGLIWFFIEIAEIYTRVVRNVIYVIFLGILDNAVLSCRILSTTSPLQWLDVKTSLSV